MKKCHVCTNAARAKGYCWSHYKKFQRHGDPMWKIPVRRGWVEDGIGYIPLTKGYVSLVDAEDFYRVSAFNWKTQISGGNKIYAARTIKKRNFRLHHFILGKKDGLEVDHINGDGLDNWKSNLRFATPSQNKMNRGKQLGCSQSKYKGVFWHGRDRLWFARIVARGRTVTIGYCKCEEDAAEMYNVAAQILHGEFASLNPV